MYRLSYRLALLALGINLAVLRVVSQDLTGYYPKQVQGITLRKADASSTVEGGRLLTMRLGAGERFIVSFDLLSAEIAELYYRLSPQTSRGEASELQPFEAFTAFAEQDISDVRQGAMIGLPYAHYTFELSERTLGFKTSGRYLLEVFERGNDTRALLQMPVYVYERHISGELIQRRSLSSSTADKEQLVELELKLPNNLSITRPEELWVRVIQNESEDFPSVVLRQPSQMRPDSWSYRGQRAAKFWAGNEYRYIEHLSTSPEGYGIAASGVSPEGWATMRIEEDDDVRGKAYQTRQDKQGRQVLRSRVSADVAYEGEYHIAEFRLRSPRLQGYDVLLEGQAFDYIPRGERSLSYNEAEGGYQIAYPLKNGYQEYRYVLVPQTEGGVAPEPIDGSYYQTENSYQAFVYYRPRGERHDRLLGLITTH